MGTFLGFPFPETARRWCSSGPLLAELSANDSPSLKRCSWILVLVAAFVSVPFQSPGKFGMVAGGKAARNHPNPNLEKNRVFCYMGDTRLELVTSTMST